MDRNITGTLHKEVVTPPPPSGDVRTLLKWSELAHPDDLAEFSSKRGAPVGTTLPQQAIYTPYLLQGDTWVHDWSVNANSVTITNDDLRKIGAMQTTDSFTPDAKMSHVTGAGSGKWGQAIKATYTPTANWRAAVDIRMNQTVYAGNQVTVLERRVMDIDTFGTVPMLRIATGWNQVHLYTAVTKDNTHYEEVKGRIYLPLLARAGWDWWILERWCK